MSRYFAVRLEFESRESLPHVLQAAAASKFLSPLGLLATRCDYPPQWCDLLLAGYAIQEEYFSPHYASPTVRNVEVHDDEWGRNTAFLSQYADIFCNPNLTHLDQPRTPFVVHDAKLDASFAVQEPLQLPSKIWPHVSEWIQPFRLYQLHLAGAVDLSTPNDRDPRWRRSYEFSLNGLSTPPSICPYICFKAYGSVSEGLRGDALGVDIVTNSTIWVDDLRYVNNAQSLGGRASPSLAQEIAHRIIQFCKEIAQSDAPRLTGGHTGTDGAFDSTWIRMLFDEAFAAFSVEFMHV